jgi:phosphoribosylanthranilate isomerase
LNPENVRQAIETVHPDGVDVSSGVERQGGGKDGRLAELFVKAVRESCGGK